MFFSKQINAKQSHIYFSSYLFVIIKMKNKKIFKILVILKEMENIPTFYFYEDDLQANGRISEQAIVRECHSLTDCLINSKLVSELKYLDHTNQPITLRIGENDVFKVYFMKTT